ncbi:hypothetical protein [Variovorax sp. OV329]|uniref:M30 family zinc metallopeptidase n=1 Tax=Variovorax sp. OV329 TaxID=1882825 RepID=UPI0008E5F460|nr:hypothetical protein [Variovorax sp. OV329]SFM88681.1 Peptidase M30 [Variovorax sp. OV329]
MESHLYPHKNLLLKAAAALAAALALSSCGGGGGGGGNSDAQASAKPDVATSLSVACSGCSAVDPNTYAGSGTGVWQASNNATEAADLPVQLKGLTGQSVTLVFTNESAAPVALPALRIDTPQQYASAQLSKSGTETAVDAAVHDNAEVSEFNRSGFARFLGSQGEPAASRKSVVPAAPLASSVGYAVGDQRSIYLTGGRQRTVQLQATKATGDGRTVNLWVEPSEMTPSRVTADMVARLRDAFAGAGGVYDMLVKVGGPLWGPHSAPNYLISGAGQPIDIFFVNLDQNSTPYGVVGYFWSLNNFRADVLPQSNQSLSMYMDTETLYLDGERGFMQIVSTLAHEGMHMQNFYRRGVLMGAAFTFDTWLEEMSAMMMEDWAGNSLNPGFNAIRDTRFPSYLGYGGKGSYNCSVTDWTPMGASCESYAVNGSFGAYLNRQFGLDLFTSLLNSSGMENSQALLDAAIKSRRPESSVGHELRYFSAAAAALVPLGAGIAGYSMPGRTDSGLSLAGIDPAAFGESRRLPTALPAMLQPLASFPVSRARVQGTFDETIRVPAGTTLTVVVN